MLAKRKAEAQRKRIVAKRLAHQKCMRKLSEKKKIANGKAQRAEADLKKLEAHGKTLKTPAEKKANEEKVKEAKKKVDEAKAALNKVINSEAAQKKRMNT